MSLPTFERVIFKKSPLRQVLGQVRFPLLIDFGQAPLISSFQRAVRNEYPKAARIQRNAIQFSNIVVPQQATEVLWRFSSRDNAWALVLGENSITLEVAGYSSIDGFLTRFAIVLEAVVKVLQVSEHGRIGLRYINEFRHPSGRLLSDWGRLLRPDFVGALATDLPGRIGSSINEVHSEQPDGELVIRHGLLSGSVVDPGPSTSPQEPFYLLDMDYYSAEEGSLDIQATLGRMRAYNDLMYNLFRWTLSDTFYEFLDPEGGEHA